jgi:hypothetical protein
VSRWKDASPQMSAVNCDRPTASRARRAADLNETDKEKETVVKLTMKATTRTRNTVRIVAADGRPYIEADTSSLIKWTNGFECCTYQPSEMPRGVSLHGAHV